MSDKIRSQIKTSAPVIETEEEFRAVHAKFRCGGHLLSMGFCEEQQEVIHILLGLWHGMAMSPFTTDDDMNVIPKPTAEARST